MGRKKIQITRIQDERNRQITFSKRKAGLLKKAYELSILCDVDIAVIMITHNSKLYQYASSNMNSILIRYTEFKDPDESKTNADILEDITKKEKSGQDDYGEEDESSSHIPFTPNTQAQYHRIDEEFDQVLHHSELASAPSQPHPPPMIIPTELTVPQAMPVTVPVSGSGLRRLGSTGSSHNTDSPITPGSIKRQRSPQSGGSIPLAGTPTRLQAIRSQTLKLHLPGGGRNYISLGSAGKSPSLEEEEGGSEKDVGETDSITGRPQLRVVIPGQKGFVSRTLPASPPIAINMDDNISSPSPAEEEVILSCPPSSQTAAVATTATVTHPVPVTVNTDSLTTPIMSLTTPSLFSSLPPGLSNFTADLPGLGDIGSASALVAFPVNIQPSSTSHMTPGGGPSNIIIQAQNTGQPFLLTPQATQSGASASPAHLLTPPTSASGGASSIRDLEQLKLQYDRIYQQISQTLQQHKTSQSSVSDNVAAEDEDEPDDKPPLKRSHFETTPTS